jgi:hypothetical protein
VLLHLYQAALGKALKEHAEIVFANTGIHLVLGNLRIPAKMNARSGDGERGFRASRTLIGAERRRQRVS